ncbi:MAG: hypothetical protein R3F61_17775 [Myxococcota bacterium]
MCMFGGGGGGPIQLKVGGTCIFARAQGERQILVYSMNVAAAEPVAMVLPLPMPPESPDDAVRFVDLSAYPSFFVDLNDAFPPIMAPASKGPSRGGGGPLKTTLKVHRAGDFEASFVPTLADFDRLDARFRLDGSVWDALPQYADWGFAVFQLSDLGPTSFWQRWFGVRPKTIHPMALEFPRRDASRLFFPTVHVHDGQVHLKESFDHSLFWQSPTPPPMLAPWDVSPIAREAVDVARTAGLVDAGVPFYRRQVLGVRDNTDHWLVDGELVAR